MAPRDPDRDRRLRRERRLARLGVGVVLALAATAPSAQQSSERAAYDAAQAVYAEASALAAEGRVAAAVERIRAALEGGQPLAPGWPAVLTLQAAEYERWLGRWRAALDDLVRIEGELGGSDHEQRLLAHLLGVRGQLYLDCGLLDLAARWLAEERALVATLVERSVPAASEHVNAVVRQAHLALALEDVGALERRAREVRDDPAFTVDPPLAAAKVEVLLGIGLAEAERADPTRPARAREVLERALAVPDLPTVERLRPELALAELAIRTRDFEDAEERLARVGELLADVGGPAPEERARSAAYRMRLVLDRDADAARVRALQPELEAAWSAFVATRAATEPRPGGYGYFHFAGAQSLLTEVVRARLRVDPAQAGRSAAFDAYVEAQTLGSLARSLGAPGTPVAPAASVDVVRAQLLGDEIGLLAWLPGPERSFLFVLDEGLLDVVELTRADVLDDLRVEALRTLARPLESGERGDRVRRREEALRALTDALLPSEVRARLGRWRGVALVGLDLLGEVPFEALTVRGDRTLGTTHAVAVLPSIPAALALAARPARTEPGETWLLFDPEPSPRVRERWPHTATLPPVGGADLLLGRPSDERLRVFHGARATPAVLARPALERASVLTFFTHGVHDADEERPSALVLTPATAGGSGLLRAREVESCAAPPCVVLLACRTGHAPLRRGDPGAADLGGAFLVAGAHAVVLSAFDLDAEAARRMSSMFHAQVERGVPPAEALRRARLLLAGDERFADPYYHGLLRVVGLGHRRIGPAASEGRRAWRIARVTALALLVLGAVLGFRRARRA